MPAPILAGQTLVMPQKYQKTRTYRGGRLEMANGNLVTDLVIASPRHLWELGWELLTPAQLATLQTAFDAIKTDPGNYTDIDGTVYDGVTNNRGKVAIGEGDVELVADALMAADGIRYKVTLRLREQ